MSGFLPIRRRSLPARPGLRSPAVRTAERRRLRELRHRFNVGPELLPGEVLSTEPPSGVRAVAPPRRRLGARGRTRLFVTVIALGALAGGLALARNAPPAPPPPRVPAHPRVLRAAPGGVVATWTVSP